MENYKLYYAELNLQGDIPCYEFKTFEDLVSYACERVELNKGKAVFLIAKDYQSTCPFITDNTFSIGFMLDKMPGMGFKSDTHIQEYESFEEAYKVALAMVEDKPLCYTKSITNNQN